ncbi:type IV pilus secretin PilQ [Dechloromonas sp.]|uniref:type IV pilus secretin PilQ n=1 Tax=Dechloromonas sp. TaxID=1917218 RepID=UPI0012005202|nr:type IV pilus secretin PilQ [Dechloromonas sp.]MBU3695654.1 type IV pilus secretin PilQ [Dechloromonas sp.]TEX46053.1 MAG: secretin [Rhodocyclaceae bacterium]
MMIKRLAVVLLLLVSTPIISHAEVQGRNAIEAINVARQGADVAIKIDMRQTLASPPAGFSIASPSKLVFDFPSTENSLGRSSEVLNQGALTSLNVVQVGERTRLVLNLAKLLNYSTRVDGKSVYVTLSPVQRLSDSAEARTTRFAEETNVGAKHAIQDVIFRRGKDGEGRIVVDLSDSGTGIDIRQQGASLVVDFMKTAIPEHLKKRLDVDDFATPVSKVETKVVGDNVRMTITPKGLWEHNAYQADNQFVVEVKRIVEDPNKLVQGSKAGFQGPRISINYQNGDVRALLRLMAEELGLNAVISETVNGTTTLVLKDVPADQVIDIIFQQKGLDMRKKGNILMIAPRDEIATREKLDFESRAQISELEPLKLEQFVLNYQKAVDVSRLLAGLPLVGVAGVPGAAQAPAVGGVNVQRILSKRGSAVADPQSNILFVNDTPSKLEEIRSFIRAIDIGARQVLIEARVVEANDTFARSLGVRLGLLDSRRQTSGNPGIGIGGGGYERTGQINSQSVNVNLPISNTIAGTGQLALSIFSSSLSRILNVEVDALESDGVGKVVSSPRVITANNVKAKIEDGLEVPYTVTQASTSGGVPTQTVNFKEAKLSLEVTPQITPDGTVKMALVVKKEEPDYERAITTLMGDRVPPIKKSVVETNVVVENGGTVVIGGIYINKTTGGVTKVPLFGDIPFLGWLFKSKSDATERRELLVFITPRMLSEKLSFD